MYNNVDLFDSERFQNYSKKRGKTFVSFLSFLSILTSLQNRIL